jgi:hypothetical protein
MVTKSTSKNNKTIPLLLFFFLSFIGNAQIGIGTITPNASSVLDITSTTQGLLTPRMTTTQKNAIVTPSDGLIVYDTTLKSFYYYNATAVAWIPLLNGPSPIRINFKLIKSTDVLGTVLAAELTAGGGSKYLLNTNTLYEINGQVVFNFPIDLNGAYLHGLDVNNDIIVRVTGNIFEGATGGTIKSISLVATAGNIFNLSGTGSPNLVFRDCIVASSNSVGTISNFGLVFFSIIQYAANKNGITYNNIGQLLLSNQGWFGSNLGTYEKFTGTFNLIEKQGGFSQVDGTAIGFDVSTSGLTITGDAALESIVFTGTNTAGYVKPYTTGTYTGYNFNNNWTVRAAGIPTEGDSNATGDLAIDYAVGTGVGVSFTNNLNPSNIVRVGTATTVSTSSNLFRFSTDAVPYRLKYLGKKKRIFQVSGSISFQVPAAGIYIIYIAKNGTTISQYKVYGRGTLAADIVVLPLNAATELTTNDYIEVFAQRYSGGNGDIVVPNMNITVK